MPSEVVNPVKLQLLEMRSDTARVSFALQNFSALRKQGGTRGGGKTWAGLKHLQDKDFDRIAIKLLETEWSGKLTGSSLMRMADQIEALLVLRGLSSKDKWEMGRVLSSALCYAQVYRMDQEARGGERGWQRPLFLIRTEESLDIDKKDIDRTRFEPFPKWTRPIDDNGNRLVRPCRPCPSDLEWEPTITQVPWLDAVHRLESVAFRINKDILRLATETDRNPDTRIIPYLPPSFERDRTELEKEYDKLGIGEMAQIREKDKALRKKDEKENDKRYKQGLDPIRSDGYHTTPDQDKIWSEYWVKWFALEDKRQRYDARRQQFEREVETAKALFKDGRPFYQRVSVDYRGRLYLPDFSYQSSDFCRAVIEFDGAEAVDKGGWKHLLRHTANAYGEAKTFEEKIDFRLPDSNTSKYIDLALDPLKHFDDWNRADKPFCFLRSCIEIMDVTTPWLKGILDRNDPEQLKHYSGQTTVSKAKKWFRRIDSRYSVLDLQEVEGDYYPAPDNLHYLSHLPCEIDQSNSAFQHIAQMMDRRDVYEKVLGADVYSDVAEKLPSTVFTDLKDPTERRKIVKIVAIPWSYGAELRTISKAVKKFRKENPDKISFLEDLNDRAITSLCRSVISQLNTEYPVCADYQDRVKEAVNEVRDRGEQNFVEWDSPFGFVTHQKVHGTRKSVGKVYAGPEGKEDTGRKTKSGKDILRKIGGDREVRVRLPTTYINWDRMRTKAPPNLVHSYDSALVHGTLWSGGRFYQSEVDGTRIIASNPWLRDKREDYEGKDLQGFLVHNNEGEYVGRTVINGKMYLLSQVGNRSDGFDLEFTPLDDSALDEPDVPYLEPEDTLHWEFPVVTIHDAFSCLASHCDEVIDALQHNFEQMYQGFDPLHRFLDSVRTGTYPLRHRDYNWIPNPDQFS